MEVPTAPAPGKITMSVNDGPEVPLNDVRILKDREGLETIRQYAKDQYSIKKRIEAATELLEGIESDWDEYDAVVEAQTALEDAKDRLKARRSRDRQYLAQTEKIAAIRREKKETNEILSDYLVDHFAKTHERQVLMDDATGDANEIKIKATLGKRTKYQTSLDLKGE